MKMYAHIFRLNNKSVALCHGMRIPPYNRRYYKTLRIQTYACTDDSELCPVCVEEADFKLRAK